MNDAPLGVFYEHPDWFKPLFAELDHRGIEYLRIRSDDHLIDPAEPAPALGALFNRMSPSAWKRGRGGSIFYTHDLLSWAEERGIATINGSDVYRLETSKARQIDLLARLRLQAPRTRVVSSINALPQAAESLVFPLIVKPNIGGSGAGIVRFDSYRALFEAVVERRIESGLDGVLLLQEYHRPADNSIVRVETLDGEYLYGIRIHLGDTDEFNLCPADVCRTVDGEQLSSIACPQGAAKAGLTVEAYTPPPDVIAAVERIARASKLDVGGIEYLESSRDGRLYFYDINALSNFVAQPLTVIGFDPTARLVDALEERLLRRVA